MDNAVMAHKRQGLQHLASESPDETSRETMEVVSFDQFVEVNAEELHGDTQMVTEVEVFSHLDDMVFLLRVLQCTSVSLAVPS